MRSLILTTLEFAVGFAPQDWRPFAFTMVSAVRATSWGADDERWKEFSALVEKWLRDVIAAAEAADERVARQARIATELFMTREMKRLGLLQAV